MASLRRWEYADCSPRSRPGPPGPPGLPTLPVTAVYSPKLTARGAKALKDLRPLQQRSTKPLSERTLEAAEAWSIPSTPGKEHLAHPSRGLELSEESRSGFFGRLGGLDVEAELQRQALLLKGLLRDVAVIRDTVWHLADERSLVTSAARDAQEAFDATEELRLRLDDLEVRREGKEGKEGKDGKEEVPGGHVETEAKLIHSLQESSLETRFEDPQWEARFEEHRVALHQQLEEHQQRLEERLQEQRGVLHQQQERHGTLHQDLQELHLKVRDLDSLLVTEVEMRQQATAEAARVSVVRHVSSTLADEVAERACQSVTPILERFMADARPSTCPAALQGLRAREALAVWDAASPAALTHRPRSPERPASPDVAQVAAELVQFILSEWRRTPTPQELWP